MKFLENAHDVFFASGFIETSMRCVMAAFQIADSDSGMNQLMRFAGAVRWNTDIDAWFDERPGELGLIAKSWFAVMRNCGDDVCELINDGCPVACVSDAAFGYVNVFKAHVNVGFFRGAELSDANGLLEGTGKYMRHVKLRPGMEVDAQALLQLINSAYTDMQKRVHNNTDS